MKKVGVFFVSIFAVLMACFSLGMIGFGDNVFSKNGGNASAASAGPEHGTGDSNIKNGCAIYVASGSTYTMTGGTISGLGDPDTNGGAVYIESGGTFIMQSGTIENCSAKFGGAVYVEKGATFTMSGGTISGCSSTNSGGAIYVCEGGAFNMLGGDIFGCSAHACGGGIFIDKNGEVDINNGSILSCEASLGSCVYVEGVNSVLGKLTLTSGETDGEIYNAGTLNFVDFLVKKIFLKDGAFITFKSEPKHVVNIELETSAADVIVAKLDGFESFDLSLIHISNMPENTKLNLDNGVIKIASQLCKVTIVSLDPSRITISTTETYVESGIAVGWSADKQCKTTIFLLKETIEITCTSDMEGDNFIVCGFIGEKSKFFGGFLNGYIIEQDITIYVQTYSSGAYIYDSPSNLSFKANNDSFGSVSQTSIKIFETNEAAKQFNFGADEPYKNDRTAVINGNSFYIDGKEVVATPNEGYRFVGWYLNDATLITNKYLFNSGGSITARFESISSFKSGFEDDGKNEQQEIVFDNKKFFSYPIKLRKKLK